MTARDAEAEQVDLGRYWHAVAARWWLPLLGLIVGAVVGYAIAVGGNERYTASSTIYLGTPYSAAGNVPLTSPQTNPSTVNTLIHSEELIHAAAAAAGTSTGSIRGGISSKSISTGVGLTAAQRTSTNPLVRISVAAATPRRASRAANSLAQQVVGRLSPLVATKIRILKARIAADQNAITILRRLITGGSADPTLKAILGVQLSNAMQDQLQAQQLLAQAQSVESPAVLTRAVAVKTSARSHRNSAVVGAFIGLIIGLIAALAWEPVARRTNR
jgi:capsular polysaccharide biosynthesis protein